VSEASRYHLSDEVLEARWQLHVRPDLFDGLEESSRPTVLLIGGQPGAGKTMGLQRARGLHPSTDFVPIIGDDLRAYHPAYLRLLTDADPTLMPAATAQASAAWVRRSIGHAQEHGYSVIVEGTFRDPATTLSTARGFAQAGHHVHLVALAVPATVSKLSCLERYYRDVDPEQNPDPATRVARWTPMAAHDAGYAGVPATLAAAAAATADVHRLTVVDRAGTLLHDSGEVGGGGRAEAVAALRRRREEPLTIQEMRTWLSSYREVQAIAERVGTTAETRDALRGLDATAKVLSTALIRHASFPSGKASTPPGRPFGAEAARRIERQQGKAGFER
jgi:UDP-N-acetylglucosamine kinase